MTRFKMFYIGFQGERN